VDALRKRHTYFHEQGCRLSDHGLETAYAESYIAGEVEKAFAEIRAGRPVAPEALLKLKSAVMVECALMDHERGWVQQLHFGAMRNNSSRQFAALGPDTGFDSIGDWPLARPLSRFLDRLDREGHLPKTIIYTLNPCANEVIASMLGNFQDGSTAGKLQFGSGWWFLDQRDGMQKQLTALANLGLLSRFVGMLTDSRSFLSYPRHEYFRRILCRLLGEWVEAGEVPDDLDLLGRMVENVSFGNAKQYFGIDL
jgi:glucuronate isomerase